MRTCCISKPTHEQAVELGGDELPGVRDLLGGYEVVATAGYGLVLVVKAVVNMEYDVLNFGEQHRKELS